MQNHSPDPHVVLITGAARGLGKGIAIEAARKGAVVAAHYGSSKDAAEALLKELSDISVGLNTPAGLAASSQHEIFQADVTDAGALESMFKAVVAKYGRLDALVNNAGILQKTDVKTMDFAQFQASCKGNVETNLTSAANLTYLAIQQMKTQQHRGYDQTRGRIVNLSSRAAWKCTPEVPAYACSKAGINLLGQTLARTVGNDQIAFFALSPTYVETDMALGLGLADPEKREAMVAQHPIGRIPTVEECGRIGAWLALEAPLGMSGTNVDLHGASYMHH